MKKLLITIFLLSIAAGPVLKGQINPKDKGLEAITMEAIKGQLEFLASDWTEGRATGEKGFYLAADYVASMFKVFGTSPAGDAGSFGGSRRFRNNSDQTATSATPPRSYFQNFTLIENLPGGSSTLTIRKYGREYAFDEGIDFMVGRATMSTKFEAPVVFVGYGIVNKENGINDFTGLDLRGKLLLRLSGFPGSNDNTSAMYKKLVGDNPRAQYDISRRKNDTLSSLGVLGVIDITLNSDVAKRWGVYKFDYTLAPAESNIRTNWTSMRLDTKEMTTNPVIITVTEKIVNLLLKDSGIDLAKYEKEAAAGSIKFKPVPMTGLSAQVTLDVKARRVNVRNVIAVIEGENPNEYVAVGAHLDHLGMDNGRIWNGADDDASGTVAVMTLARAFVASGVKPKRSIVFCAWTGEEKGLLGSEYYTMYPTAGKIGDYRFYMNFDMIARDATTDTLKNKAGITYTKSYPGLEEITKANKDQYKLNLNLNIRSSEAPKGGSDFTAFTENKIPVIAWMAAMHPDYHQPSDQVDLVNWNKMLEIVKLGYLQLWDIVNGEIK